jgi:hypothetical protein
VTSFEKEYVPEEEDCAETSIEGSAYNNTSMLEGNRTIFINATTTDISKDEASSRLVAPKGQEN